MLDHESDIFHVHIISTRLLAVALLDLIDICDLV